MRNLQTSDVFNALRIIKEAGIKDEVKRIALAVQDGKNLNVKDVGLEFILTIFDKMSGAEVEKKVYKFLGDIMEVDADDIAKRDPMQLVEDIKNLSEYIDKEKWKNFFNSVANLM